MTNPVPKEIYIFPDGEIIFENDYINAYNSCYGAIVAYSVADWVGYLEPVPSTETSNLSMFKWIRLGIQHTITPEQEAALFMLEISYERK